MEGLHFTDLFAQVLNHVIACLWYLLGYIGTRHLICDFDLCVCRDCPRRPGYEAGDNNWLENTGYTKVPGLAVADLLQREIDKASPC